MSGHTEASRARQAHSRRSPGHREKTFDKSAVARMFRAREDGLSDAEIGARFGVHGNTIRNLIGPRKAVEE